VPLVRHQELVEEAELQHRVLRYLVVGHRLAELVELLEEELTDLLDRLVLELLEDVLDVEARLGVLKRLLLDEVNLVVELVELFEESTLRNGRLEDVTEK